MQTVLTSAEGDVVDHVLNDRCVIGVARQIRQDGTVIFDIHAFGIHRDIEFAKCVQFTLFNRESDVEPFAVGREFGDSRQH